MLKIPQSFFKKTPSQASVFKALQTSTCERKAVLLWIRKEKN